MSAKDDKTWVHKRSRRHHNKTGRMQVRNGSAARGLQRIATKLKVPFDGGQFDCPVGHDTGTGGGE